MENERLLEHNFKWIPKHQRKSRFPGGDKPVSIGEPESRKPLLWVVRKSIQNFTDALYLINEMNEVMDEVNAETGGFATADDKVMSVNSESKFYKNVQPGEAIKIDEIDIIFDSDFVLNISLDIKCESLGHVQVYTIGEKGGHSETVLMWDDHEPGRNVTIKDVSD